MPDALCRSAIELADIVRCPVCRGLMDSTQWLCRACGRQYRTCGALPVLIDFEESIFQPHDYGESIAPPIARGQGGRIGRILAKLAYGSDNSTESFISEFIGRAVQMAAKPHILVIGGGSIGRGMEALYSDPRITVTGLDVYASPNIAVIADAQKLPFADQSFDGIVIQAVLEHVIEPQKAVAEAHRVLKPNGLIFSDTPFMQQVHEGAYDFTRFTFSGHRWLFRQFVQIDAGISVGTGTALLWSISHFLRSIGAGGKLALLITAAFGWVRFLERKGGSALDAASGFYFLGTKSETILRASEMVDYFQRSRQRR